MKQLWVVSFLCWASLAQPAVFERFLNPNSPRDRAILHYLALAKEGKAQAQDLAELGVLLVEKGFPQDGEKYLRVALELERENADIRFRLGLVLQRQGKFAQAVREYRKVVKARPGYAEARFMLALAEERCGRRRAAVRDYAKAYKHNPDLADPKKNPLVLDSRLQAEAQLAHYRREVEAATVRVTPLNPAALQRLMLAPPPSPMLLERERSSLVPPAPSSPSAAPATPAPPAAAGAKQTAPPEVSGEALKQGPRAAESPSPPLPQFLLPQRNVSTPGEL